MLHFRTYNMMNGAFYILKLNRSAISFAFRFSKRTILSQAYYCEKEWEKRLESPLLTKIKMDQYFVETDKKFNIKNAVSGVDIDLFANNVQEASQLEELEHLLYRFRKTKRVIEMMDSTVYAVVKAFVKFKDYEALFRILKDRDAYGIFPDLYSYNFLMDTFIKENMLKEATEVAILMMLQEDFSNEISCLLALYSCQMFLKNCPLESLSTTEQVTEEKEEENEEEETLVRVPFLRNPFFDDHFHLTKPEHLIGKTLWLVGRQMGSDLLGRTYQLLGLAMYEKWDKASEILKISLNSQSPTLISEGVEEFEKYLASISDEKLKIQFEELIQTLKQGNQIQTGYLEDHLNLKMKELSTFEERDIKLQKELFCEWEQKRILDLKKQNLELDKEKRLKEIAEKKEYFYWKEKLLFFFENETKILDEYQKAQEVTSDLQSKKIVDTYVPPEILRRGTEKLTKYQRLAKVKKLVNLK